MHAMMHGKASPQDERLADTMAKISYKIAVMSGKGGVGKSTLSVNLAWELASRGARVGLMDTDIHGPNVPAMLGIAERRFDGDDEAIEPVEISPELVVASVANIGYDPDAALIWRGPMKLGIIRQFLADVVWGERDYLVIDTPPGTGDEVLTVGQNVPQLTGIVIVTTPQGVALLDARKSVDFAAKVKVPVIGLVENMADSDQLKLFGHGGGERAAAELGIPFLGRVRLDAGFVAAGNAGRPFVAVHPDSGGGLDLAAVVERIVGCCTGSLGTR